MKKIKPFYIVFKHDFNHPHWINLLRQYKAKKIKKPSQYEVWKEFDDTIIWDSPTYQVFYFNTKEDAQNFIKLQKEQKQSKLPVTAPAFTGFKPW